MTARRQCKKRGTKPPHQDLLQVDGTHGLVQRAATDFSELAVGQQFATLGELLVNILLSGSLVRLRLLLEEIEHVSPR